MNNLEIEIKLYVTEAEFFNLKEILDARNTDYSFQEQRDIYFSPDYVNYFEKLDECLRIRIEDPKCSLNYKHIFFGENDLDTYIKEYDTEIGDISQMTHILNSLNIHEILTVHKFRYKYIYKETFEIALDKVIGLGHFVEIEVKDYDNIQNANKKLMDIIKELKLDINQKNTSGYSNMMYDRLRNR